jgi:hypothetical protein
MFLHALAEQVLHGAPSIILPPGLISAGWLVRKGVQRGARAWVIATTATQALVGALITCLMADHTLAVFVRRIQLKEEMWVRFEPHVRIAGIPWDFRLYALLLLGMLAAWSGIRFVQSAIRLANGDLDGWPSTLRTAAATTALVAPLIPLSSFPIQVLAMTVICVACSAIARASIRVWPDPSDADAASISRPKS